MLAGSAIQMNRERHFADLMSKLINYIFRIFIRLKLQFE